VFAASWSGTGHALPSVAERSKKRRTHMLGRFLVAAAVGLVAWNYRDSLREYAKGNAGPARERVDGLLRKAKQTSETLLDRAKEQISSRLENAREKVRAGGPTE
jgi:hypothetical protein